MLLTIARRTELALRTESACIESALGPQWPADSNFGSGSTFGSRNTGEPDDRNSTAKVRRIEQDLEITGRPVRWIQRKAAAGIIPDAYEPAVSGVCFFDENAVRQCSFKGERKPPPPFGAPGRRTGWVRMQRERGQRGTGRDHKICRRLPHLLPETRFSSYFDSGISRNPLK